jgi:hypothetical protein
MTPLLIGLLTWGSFQVNQTQSPRSALQVTGLKVVFFGPTQAERDSIIRADGLEAAQVLDDYDYVAGKSASFLKGRGIVVDFTTSLAVLVKMGDQSIRIFERKKMADYVGVILTDGLQEPRLLLGVASDEELIDEFKEFFRLK